MARTFSRVQAQTRLRGAERKELWTLDSGVPARAKSGERRAEGNLNSLHTRDTVIRGRHYYHRCRYVRDIYRSCLGMEERV